MSWWQWTLLGVVSAPMVWGIILYVSRRIRVGDLSLYVSELMIQTSGNVLSLRLQHRDSKYALELCRGIMDSGADATVLILSEDACYPGDFERVQEVLTEKGIPRRIARPDESGPRLLLVPGEKDILRMCRATLYVFMDALHLPYTAKIYQRISFHFDQDEVMRIRRLLALAHEADGVAAGADAAVTSEEPGALPETGPDRTGISAAESPAANPDSNQPRDPDDLIVIPRRLRGNGNPESPDTGQ